MSELDILLFTISLVTAFVSFVSIRGNKTSLSYSFALFTLCTGLWAFSIGLFDLSTSYQNSEIIARSFYILAAGIPLFFLSFSVYFTKSIVKPAKVIWPFFSLFLILSILIIAKDNFILSEIYLKNGIKTALLDLPSYFVYAGYFLVTIITAYVILIKTYFKSEHKTPERRQYGILISGTLISFLFGMFFNLILPVYSYEYIWAGPFFALLLVATIGYAIRKYNFLNTKVFTAEVLTLTIWVFILLRALIANDLREKTSNFGLLILITIFGIFLVRNVRKEIESKEKIEKLAADLSSANDRLKELDQQKSEFVSLASHQLRGPLTAVKGYGSMLLEGDFGEMTPGVKDAIEKIYKSTQDLVIVVSDYLDVSRIEQGRMQYDFSSFDLKELVQTVVNELRPNVQKANLALDFDATQGADYMINADKGKIKQVIGNLIDNSIKYTPTGSIHVWLTAKVPENKLLISISDTGVGIHPQVLPKLFNKFTRAPDASETNIMGTGLGLYVAKKMIEAHRGRIWAESAGQGKGSTFFIELDSIHANQQNIGQDASNTVNTPPVIQSSDDNNQKASK